MHRIVSFLLACTLALCLPGRLPTLAAESTPAETAALQRCGWVMGCEDGALQLDRAITKGEFLILLCRAAGRTPPTSLYSGVNNGWLALEEASGHDSAEPLSISLACSMLAAASCHAVYPVTSYSSAAPYQGPYADACHACRLLGFLSPATAAADPAVAISRADAFFAVQRAFLCEKTPTPLPTRLSALSIQTYTAEEEPLLSQVLPRLLLLPDDILQQFSKEGWQLIITAAPLQQVYPLEMSDRLRAQQVMGLTSYQLKCIYVQAGNPLLCDPDAVLHEMGHFWDHITDYTMEHSLKALMDEEGATLRLVTGSSYCMSGEQEYFAELFRAYFASPQAKSSLPKGFSLISSLLPQV